MYMLVSNYTFKRNEERIYTVSILKVFRTFMYVTL